MALLLAWFTDKTHSTLLKCGDFPGFYVLGMIARLGLWSQLYDPELQRNIENLYWPHFEGGYYMSVYPPFVALFVLPLAYLPPLLAKYVFTGVCVLCFVGALLLVSRLNTLIKENFVFTLVALIFFAPIFYGVIGAQNTSISMFLFAASLYFLQKGNIKGEFLSGVVLGLWLFKPQFGLLAIFFLLWTRKTPLIGGALLSTALLYILGWIARGALWPISWYEAVSLFSPQNYIANQAQQVSLIGFSKTVVRAFNVGEVGSHMVMTLGVFATMFVAFILVRDFWKVSLEKDKEKQANKLLHAFLLMGVVIPLISPQTLFYDLGISALVSSVFVRGKGDREINFLLTGLVLIGVITYYRDVFLIPPLVLLNIGMWSYVYVMGKRIPKQT